MPPEMTLEEARKRLPPIWIVYDHPRDAPKKWVVRVWYGLVPEPDSTYHDTLSDARESIFSRGGCVLLGRSPGDDPAIAESWI
jgi:hypothetical protein